MLVSVARTLSLDDPRVGAAWAPDTPPAGPEAKGPLCPAPASSGSLEGFPYGSSLGVQVLHAARHLMWYALLRPARLGSLAGLLNVIHLVCAGLLLLLAVSTRKAAVWAWWRRFRLAFMLAASLLARCVLLLAAFLLLLPHTWPSHTWTAYVVNATSSPVAHALAMGVHSLLVKVPLPAAAVQALAHMAAVFVLAYHVSPSIVTRWREQHWGRASPTATTTCDADGPVPLQCGSPLRPEHSALLSCRPLALQVLLGLAMVAWPVGLSWAVERRLRRQHAAVCGERARRRRQRVQQEDVPRTPSWAQQHSTPTCSKALIPVNPQRAAASGSTCRVPVTVGSLSTPAEAPAVCPCLGTSPASASAGAPRPSARYRSRMTFATASVKVQEHPGDYEEYGSRLASVLQDCVREELRSRAAAGTVPDQQAAAPEPLLWTTVIRGCVQVVLWGWVPDGEGEVLGGEEADGAGDTVQAEQLLQQLVLQLMHGVAQHEGPRSVRGVSVQVGQQVAVLGDPSQGTQLPGVVPLHGDSGGGGGGGTSVRLLQTSPPAASLAAAAASGSLTVRLLLHSPAPQPARVLVLAERRGDASSSDSSAAESAEPYVESRGCAMLPQRVLLELPVQLVGGVQEVEVELGAGELAGMGAVEANEGQGVAADEAPAAGVLRFMMVGPVHQTATVDEEQKKAAAPPPLVHWVAPPLLLLPPAAAAEVCGAWGAMQQAVVGGPGPAEEEMRAPCASRAVPLPLERGGSWGDKGLHQCTSWGQQGGGQQQDLRGDESLGTSQHAGTPPASDSSSEQLASAERRSSLWWSHMAPLLGDLAHVLGAQQGAADSVSQALLPYLQGRGMAKTLSVVLGRRSVDHHSHRQQQQPSTGVGAYHPAPRAYHPTRRPFLVPLPRPFSPPILERQYQQWRLERLTPYALLAFDSCAALILLLRALVTTEPLPVGAVGVAPLPLRLVHIVVFMLLTTVADTLGLVVLYVRAVQRPSNQQQQQEQGRPEGAGFAASRRTAVLSPRDVVWYRLAACVAGPAVLLLCGAQTFLGVTPLDPRAVGKLRFTYGTGLNRAVVVPCLQQMSTWEAVAAAPLVGVAETLVLMHMQPTWGVWRAGAGAAVWRLVAVAVSAAWEWRSRRRFVQGQRQQAAGAAAGDLRGSGAGKGPGGSKKRV